MREITCLTAVVGSGCAGLNAADWLAALGAEREAAADRAVERGIGARGLRAVLEEVMTRVMYQVPSDPTIVKVTITPETVAGGEPVLEYGAVRKRYKNTVPVV